MIKRFIHEIRRRLHFRGSGDFWESNYASGGNSGHGSYGVLAEYKAKFINTLIEEEKIVSVIEFGSGDGNQLSLGSYPTYIGVDVSRTAVDLCRNRFAGDGSKRFLHAPDYQGEQAELALSLDVIYHLVENDVFEGYMRQLFHAGTRFVVVYSTNHKESYGPGVHVRHRKFTDWTERNATEWNLVRHARNPHAPRAADDERAVSSPADFYVFQRRSA